MVCGAALAVSGFAALASVGGSLKPATWVTSPSSWSAKTSEEVDPTTCSVHYDKCIQLTPNIEWNYFHFFERNVIPLSSSVTLDGHVARNELVIVGKCINSNLIKAWTHLLFNVAFQNGDEHGNMSMPGSVCCASRPEAASQPASWEVALPKIRQHVWTAVGLGRVEDQPPPVPFPGAGKGGGGASVLCFMGRNNSERSRTITNAERLTQIARELGYEPRSLVFDGKSPEEQVKMMVDCSVSLGIHGAHLTNWMFLRPGALAIQIAPYRCSSGFIGALRRLAEASNMNYMEWAPTNGSLYDVQWDSMAGNEQLLKAVCKCGIERLLEHGTKAPCYDDNDLMNYGLWVNQNIEVPEEVFRSWFQGPPAHGGAAPVQGLGAALVQTAAAQGVEASMAAAAEAFTRRVDALLESLAGMGPDEAKQLCARQESR